MDYTSRATLNVEFFTPFHRISGVIHTRRRLFSEILNDQLTSSLELTQAFMSHLWSPDDLVSCGTSAVVIRKSRVLFAILTIPEKLVTEREIYALFNKQKYRVFVCTSSFEITGIVETLSKSDVTTLLASGEGFLGITKATAKFIGSSSPLQFQGEQIFVNRTQIDLLSVQRLE